MFPRKLQSSLQKWYCMNTCIQRKWNATIMLLSTKKISFWTTLNINYICHSKHKLYLNDIKETSWKPNKNCISWKYALEFVIWSSHGRLYGFYISSSFISLRSLTLKLNLQATIHHLLCFAVLCANKNRAKTLCTYPVLDF